MTPTTLDRDAHPDAAGGSLDRYLDEIGRYPLLTRDEEVRLARAAEGGDRDARRRLVESNLRLVVAVARAHRAPGVELLDLVQEGNLGLMAAAERFDWRRDVRFATFATWWIRRAVVRAATEAGPVRVPDRVGQAAGRLRAAERTLEQTLGRSPTLRELAAESGLDETALADARRFRRIAVPLHEPLPGADMTLEDVLPDPAGGDLASSVAEGERRASLQAALGDLGRRERAVVAQRYGLGGGRPRSLEEVAGGLGLSRERVRQVERRSLRALAAHPRLRSERLAA